MLFTPKKVKKHLLGGEITPAEQPTPPTEETPTEGGQDPIMMLAEAAALALQSGDCLIALQVCQGLMALMLLMGGGTPQELQGEPVFKKGGTLLRRIKK